MGVDTFKDKEVITRKPHNCWGCTDAIPIGTKINVTTSADTGKLTTAYWCKRCLDYMDEHLDYWDRQNGFEYGELRSFEDYPENEAHR